MWVGEKFQSNPEIAGSPRNSFRASLGHESCGGRALNFLGGVKAYRRISNSECHVDRTGSQTARDKLGSQKGKSPDLQLRSQSVANIGQIPRFDKLIATIRSREMSASIILQSQSQLKAIYKDAAEIILDNADSTLFLGGRGKNAKDISDNLGRETIDSFNTSENRGTQVSHGLTYQKLGKELMTQDEIAVMDGGKCILQLRGVRPFLSDKYDITKHPNYKYLSDFDKRNAFDVERYMSTRPAIVKPDEAFDIYEIDLSDEDAAAEE